jgi:hypothetical protein
MDVSQAQEVKLVADLRLGKEVLQSVIRKNGWSVRKSGGSGQRAEAGHSASLFTLFKVVETVTRQRL